MRAAAEHLCFIDSGHLSIDRNHLMPHALLQQGYDRGVPVDLQLIRSSRTTIAWSTCRWFRSPKKMSPQALMKGLMSEFTCSGWRPIEEETSRGHEPSSQPHQRALGADKPVDETVDNLFFHAPEIHSSTVILKDHKRSRHSWGE